MDIPGFNRMSDQQLFIVLIGLLVVIGLVSALMLAPPDKGGCCGNTITLHKTSELDGLVLERAYWKINKTAENNNIYNASDEQINYSVKITEIRTESKHILISGEVEIANNGKDSAFIANAVNKLFVKNQSDCYSPEANVLSYDDSVTSVETCNLSQNYPGAAAVNTEGIGSIDFVMTDEDGNDVFATDGTYTSGMYEIKPKKIKSKYVFTYFSNFDLDALGINASTVQRVRDQIIFTFIDTPGTGKGTCRNIDATGTGSIPTGQYQSVAFHPGETSPCNNAKELTEFPFKSSLNITFYDKINESPDQSIVTVPDFTINYTGLLKTDGSNVWTTELRATGVPGTVFTIPLNSSANCTSDGKTSVRNMAWIEADDMETIYDSPTYSQIDFYCGVEPPPIEIGDICTFTQSSYGGETTAGFEIMNSSFSTIYPSGLVVGNNGGPYTLTLTSGDYVQAFLEQNETPPSYLISSLTDPTSTSARQFAGEVVALQLNVDLSDEGVMPQNSPEIFGNLTVKGTGTSLDWKKVRDVLGIANCLLANGTDCDGYNTTDIPMVNNVLQQLNLNYYNCENDFNHTGPGDENPPIIWSVEAVPDLLAGNQAYDLYVNVTDDVGVDSVNITVDGAPNDLNPPTTGDIWHLNLNAPSSDGTYTIHVTAYDEAGNMASDSSETIVVDDEPPLIVIIPPPSNDSVIYAGTLINFSVTDAHLEAVKYNITKGGTAGSSLVDFDSPFDVNTTGWDDGEYTIFIWANDSVGNENHKTYRFTIDSSAPTVSVSATPNETNNDNNVTFTAEVDDDNYDKDNVWIHCEDGETFTEKMDCSGSSSPYTCTFEWDPSNDGVYECTVNATDLAGNTGTSDPIEVIIDSTPPDISLNDPTEYSYIQAGTMINITVTNDMFDELEDVWFSTDGGSTNSSPLSDATDPLYYLPTTGLECQFTFDVWASDSAGNIGHANFTFNIDNNDPVINSVTVSTPTPLWPSMLYNVTVNATDTKMMDYVTVTVNGAEYTLTHSTGDIYYYNGLVAPGPGTYTVNVTAYDKSGRSSYDDSKSIKVTLPPGPIIVLDSPPNGATIKNTVPILVNITNSTKFQVDTALFNSSTNPTYRPFDSQSGIQYTIDISGYADGTYDFGVFANDTNGAVSTAQYNFTIDSTAPIVENLTITPNLFSSGTSVTFSADVYEELGLASNKIWFYCKNSTGSWKPGIESDACIGSLPNLECSVTLPISYADGIYQCRAYGEDKAGNFDYSGYEQMTIDSQAPVITINSPLPTGSYVIQGTKIDLDVTNGVYDALDTVQYQVDGGSWMPLASPYDIPTNTLLSGLRCFNATANDTAGNVGTLNNFCYKFDNIPPTIHSVETDPVHVEEGDPLVIKVNATDLPFPIDFFNDGFVNATILGQTYELTYNSTSGLWEATDQAPFDEVAELCGDYTITVTAQDPAGNTATDSSSSLRIVGCSPKISLLSPTTGSTVSKTGTKIYFSITHQFNFTANLTVTKDSAPVYSDPSFTSPFEIVTNNWPDGTNTVFIEAVDQYGYYSNGTFTFVVQPYIPPGPPDGKEELGVSMDIECPGDYVIFTVKDKDKDPVKDVDVNLVDEGANSVHKLTNSNGIATFTMTEPGDYRVFFTKSPKYTYTGYFPLAYSMCPTPPPPPCDDEFPCPGDQICQEGKCIPPECDDVVPCPTGEICVSGRCEPEPPECDDMTPCPPGQVCDGGTCVPEEEPECETDGDCDPGYKCEGGSCQPIPDLEGTPPEGPVGEPGGEVTLEFEVNSTGSAPVHNVRVTVDGSGLIETIDSGPTISVLNPGESETVTITVRVLDDVAPGNYPITVIYSSDEVTEGEQFTLGIAEEVVPGIVWADLVGCLVPLLIALALLALYWLLTKRKVVADLASLKELQKSGKLGFAKKYYVSQETFSKVGPSLQKQCVAVKVGKTRIRAVAAKYKLAEEDAALIALAEKVGANRVVSMSKGFAKYVKMKTKLGSISFLTPSQIAKPQK